MFFYVQVFDNMCTFAKVCTCTLALLSCTHVLYILTLLHTYSCTPILLNACHPVLKYFCTLVLLYSCTLVLLYSCTPVLLYSYKYILLHEFVIISASLYSWEGLKNTKKIISRRTSLRGLKKHGGLFLEGKSAETREETQTFCNFTNIYNIYIKYLQFLESFFF